MSPQSGILIDLYLFINSFISIIDRQATYRKPRVIEDKLGDTYLLGSSGEFFLRTSNAEVISQVTARHRDFPKPVWRFKIVDIFGKSILTAEDGEEWKRHHKIVGPSFSERSNRLVFEESLRQAEGMLSFWDKKSKKGAIKDELRISDTSGDTGTLTLHVICAAGFGIPQLWENQSAENLGERALPGFSDDKLTGGHTLSFKKSLTTILSHILWFMVLPPRLLRRSQNLYCTAVHLLITSRKASFPTCSCSIYRFSRMHGIFPRPSQDQARSNFSRRRRQEKDY